MSQSKFKFAAPAPRPLAEALADFGSPAPRPLALSRRKLVMFSGGKLSDPVSTTAFTHLGICTFIIVLVSCQYAKARPLPYVLTPLA